MRTELAPRNTRTPRNGKALAVSLATLLVALMLAPSAQALVAAPSPCAPGPGGACVRVGFATPAGPGHAAANASHHPEGRQYHVSYGASFYAPLGNPQDVRQSQNQTISAPKPFA